MKYASAANVWRGVAVALFGVCSVSAVAQTDNGLLTTYTNPAFLTAMPFGARSHWVQPWRAYMDTWPASRLRNSVGINLNVTAAEADATCRHLAANGFRSVRIEFGWGTVRYDDPTQLTNQADFDQIIAACKKNGLRPLFLLNAHHGLPCPVQQFTVRLTQAAKKGARTVTIDPGTLKQAVVGRSGLSNLSEYWAAECLFTDIQPNGTVTLSKPLPKDLPAGNAAAATLKFLPFYPSKLKGTNTVPAAFQETMQGWLTYVKTIAANARRVLGTTGLADAGFDMEVWNELGFGSRFLNINNYYDTTVADGDDPTDTILRQTLAFVRDPANAMPNVGVGDGFESQRPWGAGSILPPGLTAMDKHPYPRQYVFPQNQIFNGVYPINALGQKDAKAVGNQWQDTFVPNYVSFFPEYFLTGIQTETLIRDLAPVLTNIYGANHGRNSHANNADGSPASPLEMWVTEVNLAPAASGRTDLTPATGERMKAKLILRTLASFVNKGASRIYFYAAKDLNPQGMGLVSNDFFTAVKNSKGAMPANVASVTSPTLRAIGQFMQQMGGDINPADSRSLSLQGIYEPQSQIQFAGDPTTATMNPNPRPPLYNRDVLGFFPFQTGAHRFVIPVYVMTRDIAHNYKPAAPAGDATRFDMPQETFQLNIGNVQPGSLQVSLYDPLDNVNLPARVVSAGTNSVVVEIAVTDSPRLLILQEN